MTTDQENKWFGKDSRVNIRDRIFNINKKKIEKILLLNMIATLALALLLFALILQWTFYRANLMFLQPIYDFVEAMIRPLYGTIHLSIAEWYVVYYIALLPISFCLCIASTFTLWLLHRGYREIKGWLQT